MKKSNTSRQLQVGAILISVLFVSSTFSGEPTATYKGPKEKLHIYLLIGQSNMAGRAPIPKSDAGPIERCYLLNKSDQWEVAKNPLNIYSSIRKNPRMQRMNPGYMFAKTMLENDASISVGLVVNAKGGTSIKLWKKGGKFYKEALRRLKAGMAAGTLKGILWHQGESDTGDKEYVTKLKELISALRQDLGVKDLPFVVGQLMDKPHRKRLNEEFAKVPKEVPATGCASSEGLTAKDGTHFDTKSMKLIGKRYAEEMIRLLGKKPAK